jgi:hypothetical protein
MSTTMRIRPRAAWATWACKRRKPPHVRPTQVGLKGPGRRLPGLFFGRLIERLCPEVAPRPVES